jgi:hypothetical protein
MSTQSTIEAVDDGELRPIVVKISDRQPPSRSEVSDMSSGFEAASRACMPFSLQTASGLLTAFDLIARRGTGESSWAAPLGDDPIAFLLDSISDAANLWSADGALLCRNRASLALGPISAAPSSSAEPASVVEAFSARDRRYERRSLRCRIHSGEYVLEVIRELAHF